MSMNEGDNQIIESGPKILENIPTDDGEIGRDGVGFNDVINEPVSYTHLTFPEAREIVDAFCRMERSSNPAGGITRPYELSFRLLVLVERIQEAVNILLRQVIRRGQPQLVRVASSDANFLFFP